MKVCYKQTKYMYWVFGFFLCVIILMVIFTHRAKAEKDAHNWLSETDNIDEKLKKRMQDLACCPSTLYDSSEPAKIEKAYKEARERGEREGFFPFILILEENLESDILGQLGVGDNKIGVDMANVQLRRQELMQTMENGKDWLDLQLRVLQHNLEAESPDFYKIDVMGEYVTNGIGNTSFNGIINDETGRTLPLLLAEVPVQQPWQILAWFPFGGWNACPKAEHLVNVAKHWYDSYGAIPAVIAHGIVEFVVPQPVSEEKSLSLAEEHYAFCTDIVDQNLGTINALADVLRKSTVWFFWWD